MKAEVIGSEWLSGSVIAVRLRPEQPLSFRPGQFITVPFEQDRRKVIKSYSIVSSPSVSSYIELCIKVVEGGPISNRMAGLKPGEELEIKGPFGHFTLQEGISNDVVFVATGTGISALKPMVDEALRRTRQDVWLFFGVRTEEDILYRKDFEQLTRGHDNFHFIPVLSDSESPDFEHGHVQDAFRKLISLKGQDVYICGLYVMVDEMRQICLEMGFPKEKLHFEKYI